MQIIQIDTADRGQARVFHDLPFSLYRSTPRWVPPLAGDARAMLDPAKHPYYQHSEAAFFLALDESGQAIGRLAALDNARYNEFNHERTAFFYLFECVDDRQAALGLFDAACAWARGRGLNRITGPKGFSALDGQGLLVHGFDHRPALGIPYNLSYYAALVEAAGFTGIEDVLSGYLSRDVQFPEKIHRVAETVRARRGLEVLRFRTRRDLVALVPKLQAMYNASLGSTTGNVPLTDADMRALAQQILWFADPRLIKIVMKGDEPAGFLLAYPDISAALQRHGGRLFPLGWLDAWLELRRTPWLNINGAGMVEKYRGLGGTALLFSEMQKTIVESRFQHVDIVQVGVKNGPMQAELRGLGIDFYKTHRLYARDIPAEGSAE